MLSVESTMKCNVLLILLLVFSNSSDGNRSYRCDFFNDLSLIVTPKSRIPSFKTHVSDNFNGCFSDDHFDEIVKELALVDQKVTEIGDHAVNNMLELTSISFTGCGTKKITSRAFENLPKLRVINIVDCNLTSVSAGTFNDLESLEDISLSQNDISYLGPSPVFGYMPSLKQVILKRNKLRAIDFIWFSESPNISLLDVSHNKIQNITKVTFRSLPNLKDLFLDFNEIKFIEDMSFHNISRMEILSLRHNRLTQLSPNIIADRFQVQLLQLNANFLNYLSESLLKKLSVERLELIGNPWKCPCLDKIHEWMLQTNVTLKNNGYCQGDHFPKCFYSKKASYCSETIDSEMTELFLKELRDTDPPIEDVCANLS